MTEVTHSIDFDNVEAGTTSPMCFHVHNAGATADSFEVRGAANEGRVGFGFKGKNATTTVTLASGASAPVQAQFILPAEVVAGSELMLTLTATSTGNPTATNSATVSLTTVAASGGCSPYTQCYDTDGDGVDDTCVLITPSCAPPGGCCQ